MHKREHEHRLRGSRILPSERRALRFVGIDIGAERHVGAIVGEDGAVLMAATPFQEDAEGYRQLLAFMRDPTDTVVAMEATGHYW
jgi:transposase